MNDTQNEGLFATIVSGVKGLFVRAYVRYTVYNKLAVLSDRMLADIGLTRADIKRIADEAAKNAARGKTVSVEVVGQTAADIVTLPVGDKVVANDEQRAAAA